MLKVGFVGVPLLAKIVRSVCCDKKKEELSQPTDSNEASIISDKIS